MSLGDTPAADQVAAQRELEQALDSLLARRVDPESALGRALDAQSSPVDALPSPELDSAIRAAARRAVSAGPRPTGEADIPAKPGRRWWGWGAAPMAAAAVIVLAVSVTTLVDREQQVAERIAAAQAPVVAAPAETVPQVADAARSSAKNAGGEAEGTSVPQRQAPAEATPPPPPPAPARAQAKADLNQNAAASAPPAVTAAASRPVERAAAVAESSLASDAARARTPEPFAAAADARANAGASAAPRAQSAAVLDEDCPVVPLAAVTVHAKVWAQPWRLQEPYRVTAIAVEPLDEVRAAA
jgi:hypothetical protein